MNKLLRIFGEAQEELPVGLQLINGINGFVNFRVEALDFLLARRTQQEIVHLSLQSIVDL